MADAQQTARHRLHSGDQGQAPGCPIRCAVTHFTAPRVTPEMTQRWANTYTMSRGAIAIR